MVWALAYLSYFIRIKIPSILVNWYSYFIYLNGFVCELLSPINFNLSVFGHASDH